MAESTSTSEQGSGVADMQPSGEGLAPVAGEKLPEELGMEGDVKGEDSSATMSMEDGLDRLLHRHRSEIMFELRRLQMGDRPVTGQGHREAVEDFFNQAAPPADGTAPHRTTNNHRPESIIVEVNALVERRRVSSMLQSDLFRRNLETMVRGTLGRLGPLVTTYRPTPTADRRETGNATLSQEPVRDHEPETRQQQPEMAEVVQQQSDQSPTNQTQPQPSDPPSSPEQQHTHAHREAILDAAREAHLPEATPTFAQAWLQQFDARADGTSMWTRLQEAERESLVAEISDLVQRQLVTSTLQSERRDRLERNLRRHVADSGIDGRRAQEALRLLPPSASHRRNDFSNLGIGAALSASLSDELDAISVVSATAAVSVPYDQSNRALRHEMQQLRSQMQSLQRSVQLSFDLQLEIQRSVRQEVAASLARCHVTSAAEDAISRPRIDGPATTDSPLPRSQPASDGKCLICLDRSVDTVFYQCGHMCVCYPCGMELRARGGNCLMCRAPIRDAIKVYRASMD